MCYNTKSDYKQGFIKLSPKNLMPIWIIFERFLIKIQNQILDGNQ